MKKRIFACILACLILATVFSTAAYAAVPADAWSSLKFNIFTQTSMGYNFAELDTNGMLGHGQQVMRGFCRSARWLICLWRIPQPRKHLCR